MYFAPPLQNSGVIAASSAVASFSFISGNTCFRSFTALAGLSSANAQPFRLAAMNFLSTSGFSLMNASLAKIDVLTVGTPCVANMKLSVCAPCASSWIW
jgi:hypothetical protein